MFESAETKTFKCWTQSKPWSQNNSGVWITIKKTVNCLWQCAIFSGPDINPFTRRLVLVFYDVQKHSRISVFPGTPHYIPSACIDVNALFSSAPLQHKLPKWICRVLQAAWKLFILKYTKLSGNVCKSSNSLYLPL